MAFFAAGSPLQTAAPTNVATLVFDTDASGIAAGATLTDVAVSNVGTVNIFLGGSTVTTSTGLLLKPGGTCLLQGQSALQSSTAGDIYAITTSGTGSTISGLMSVDPII